MDEQNAADLTMKHGSISKYKNIGKLNTHIRSDRIHVQCCIYQ